MSSVKNALVSTKNFVDRHKVAIAITVTAVTTAVVVDKLRGSSLHTINEFVREKGLEDEYTNWLITPSE